MLINPAFLSTDNYGFVNVLVAPTVIEFGPMDINVDENNRVEFVCKAVGPPTPALKVVKSRPTPGKR
jgi:hypothetical protein